MSGRLDKDMVAESRKKVYRTWLTRAEHIGASEVIRLGPRQQEYKNVTPTRGVYQSMARLHMHIWAEVVQVADQELVSVPCTRRSSEELHRPQHPVEQRDQKSARVPLDARPAEEPVSVEPGTHGLQLHG